jgi:hypothetical protein
MTRLKIDSMLALAARIVGLICVCVVSSCSAESTGVDAPKTGPKDPPVQTVTCTEGTACECKPGQPGTLSCRADGHICECEQCPALQVHDAAKTEACGGEPFGVWRLTQLDLGRTPMTVSANGQSNGTCDLMLDTPSETPRVLMKLREGGTAEYDTKQLVTKAHWSESCISSKTALLACGSDGWTGVWGCALDCDICTCSTTLGKTPSQNAGWRRTATTLSVAPLGNIIEFDYCVNGSKLTLSGADMSLEFEQVFTVDTPTACEQRSQDECTLGEGCGLGVCQGSSSCAQARYESACLTMQGCTWDATACTGRAGDCTLADFGTVPGCEFVDQATTCVGTPTACTALDVGTCADRRGCKVNKGGRCAGPSLPCADFSSCPIGYCTWDSPDCHGTSSCAAFNSETQCDNANENFPNSPCTWEPAWCEGDAEPCSSYEQSVCGTIPGCKLGTP